MSTDNRPLSPHLQVYRLPFTALTSISHRISGVLLSGGALVLVYWVVAAAAGPQAYATASSILSSLPVQVLIFLWTFVLFYHLCNGIRHLVWDVGYGFDLKTAQRSGQIAIGAAAALTLIAWLIALV
ncbi:succinate dehydrogenase, cytochrome b556 subunit [Spiribacter aquaticus]|jgi:succinate dehydrogenase / fumarate reductase cytochrome b subunit|uniref:Succinate dehydrogenase cytochrome b556 subunit n=1 Tax=Spiribacter aquaticus TaxID=1935996 RepID=A0A557RI10_9GAMM|nr:MULTISPECIES: succinate dehydrogenase, cytochrome b556 subunit [Spiribacter]KAF0280544.1 succinate dehydrogenase, cytochrome b556 subunit [Spiribacter roseus]PZA00388.1 succinate dehydrogenase, cytochrome b556 subunit [Gammaproteobacteria bacterium 2W06]TVO64706.1 succinate dehydrogenase, cytochrome b556 subunit [Spiribacter aquaticus]